MNKAIAVTLPEMQQTLKPGSFTMADDKAGWVLKIPGERPIATPAYADGWYAWGGNAEHNQST